MKEPEWVLREVVFMLHEQSLAQFGGTAVIRDEGLLDSALGRPLNLFAYGKPSLFDLAASYAFGLSKNHPFLDGNKRTGFIVAVTFLELNGQRFAADEVDAAVRMLALAAGELSETAFLSMAEIKLNARMNFRVHAGTSCGYDSPSIRQMSVRAHPHIAPLMSAFPNPRAHTSSLSRATFFALVAMFAVAASAAPPVKESDLAGTWQWISFDGQPVKKAFYVRFYPDGLTASWPAPADWGTTVHGVSHGRYHLEGQFLVLETGAGKDSPKARFQIKDNEMILIGYDSHRLVYRRVLPTLEPGKFRAEDIPLKRFP